MAALPLLSAARGNPRSSIGRVFLPQLRGQSGLCVPRQKYPIAATFRGMQAAPAPRWDCVALCAVSETTARNAPKHVYAAAAPFRDAGTGASDAVSGASLRTTQT